MAIVLLLLLIVYIMNTNMYILLVNIVLYYVTHTLININL